MLGWSVGTRWKVSHKSWVPSLAAVLDPPDEVQEDILEYEVVHETDRHWIVKLGKGSIIYELHYFKAPLALHKVVCVDSSRPGCKALIDEKEISDSPKDFVDPLIGHQFPFMADFPALKGPPKADQVTEMAIDGKDSRSVFYFEAGRPYWTNAKKFYHKDRPKFEAWLIVSD